MWRSIAEIPLSRVYNQLDAIAEHLEHLDHAERRSVKESSNPSGGEPVTRRPQERAKRSKTIVMRHFQKVTAIINGMLSQNRPETFSSAWILKHAPQCYWFICKNIRTEVGAIDWDSVTHALEPKYQRLWVPRVRKSPKAYRDGREVDLILNTYRNKLYVFLAPADETDLRIRDKIAVALVRVAQAGNLLAKAEVVGLVRYTVDNWVDEHVFMSRWRGHEDEIREHIEGCIRRYRYSGSFLKYLFRTLEYAGRGIRPLLACSLGDSL